MPNRDPTLTLNSLRLRLHLRGWAQGDGLPCMVGVQVEEIVGLRADEVI